MTEKSVPTFGKTSIILRLILLMSAILLIMAPLGCKEKAQAPAPAPKVVGTCEVFDKLPGDIAKPVEVNFGNKVKLLGISVNKESLTQLKMSYYWQITEDPAPYNSAFVIFMDKDNKQVMGNDHDLCPNQPFSRLKGKFIKETYTVDILPPAVGKKIDVGVGIFSTSLKPEESRLKIISAGKVPVTDVNTRAIVEELNL